MLQDEEVAMLSELSHLQEVVDQVQKLTADPYTLPPASEQVLSVYPHEIFQGEYLVREKQWKLHSEGLRKLYCPPIILINWSPPWGIVLRNFLTVEETHTLLLCSQEHTMGPILSQMTPVESRTPYFLSIDS